MLKKKKLLLLILVLVIIIAIILITIYRKNNNSPKLTPEMAISKINEEYFEISFNSEEKTANVDGNIVKLTDLFGISERELNEMISNNTFEKYLNENLIGDIQYSNNQVNISNPYSTNRLIIKTKDKNIFEEYTNIAEVKEIAENIYIVEYENAKETKNGYEELKEDESIINVIKDHKVYISDTEFNIESVSSKNTAWGVNTTGLGHYKTKLNYSENNNDITVAVLDTGINASHEAFTTNETADKISYTVSYDYVNDDSDVTDDNGHGTAVAGVIAESTSDNIKIVPVKVIDENGEGSFINLIYAIANVYEDVDIINLSLGSDSNGFSEEALSELEEFFKFIYDSGTIIVCAAGNEAQTVAYPASSAYTLAASAVDSSNNFASSFSNYGEEVDFALPGVSLKLPYYKNTNTYATMSGTSFSSPFLAAAVADVKADYGYSDISDILDVLKENAEDLGDSGKDDYYGYGSLNFDYFMFESPVIVSAESNDTNWATENTISVKAVSGYNMEYYALTTENETPTEWTSLGIEGTSMELETKTTNNGTNYFWIKDENDNIVNASVEIKYVDNINPTVAKFISSNIECDAIDVDLQVQDSDSGISEIKWYYKKLSDEQYTEVDEDCKNDDEGEKSSLTKTHTFSDLESNIEYNIFAKIIDVVGNSIETDILNVSTLRKEGTITIENKTGGKAKILLGEKESTENFSITTEEEKFMVYCDLACVVILVNENEDSYSRIDYANVDNNYYEFDYEIDDLKFIIALKGDVNLNGTINAADTMLINRSKLSSSSSAYIQLSNIQKIVGDINKNGELNSSDSMLINRAMLSETSDAYSKIEW